MAQLSAAVGPNKRNYPSDVKTVQALLNRQLGSLIPLTAVKVDGVFGSTTESLLGTFQQRVVGMAVPDGVVSPKGPTLRQLQAHSGDLPANVVDAKVTQSIAGLSEEELTDAARQLGCEVAAIKAVVKTELGIRAPFDSKGRPTILYERHYFSKITGGKHDKAQPAISNPVAGGYGKFSEQYPKLDRAILLNRDAALRSASWGAFQIMGDNYAKAGFVSVEEFVKAMQTSLRKQLDAFVAFVSSNARILKALQIGHWATFAAGYNGASYKKNEYDIKMKLNYESFRGKGKVTKP